MYIQVKRKLPDWLALPDVVHADIANEKKPLTEMTLLADDIIVRLQENGITHLFPGMIYR